MLGYNNNKMAALVLCIVAALLTSVHCDLSAPIGDCFDCSKQSSAPICRITITANSEAAACIAESSPGTDPGRTGDIITFPKGITMRTTLTVGDVKEAITDVPGAEKPPFCPGEKELCIGSNWKCLVKAETKSTCEEVPNKKAGEMKGDKCVVDPSKAGKDPADVVTALKTCVKGGKDGTDVKGGKDDKGAGGSATGWYISKGVGILIILTNLIM